jgi:hypothetical protein
MIAAPRRRRSERAEGLTVPLREPVTLVVSPPLEDRSTLRKKPSRKGPA